jgi:hypothetical protein
MSSSKKIALYRDFAAGVYLSENQNPRTHTPLTYFIRVQSILIHTAKGGSGKGVELNQREG